MAKKKRFYLLVFLFTSALMLESCYKDNILFEPYESPTETASGDKDDFFEEIPDFTVSETVSMSQTSFLITENETIFQIPEKAFIDTEGNVIEGDVDFQYIELLDPALYTFYNLPTISNGKLLRTEGVFRFEAFKDGKKLDLAEGKTVTVRLPDEDPEEGMDLFYGQGKGENFNWVLASNVTAGTDAPIRINEWGFELDSLQNWVSGFGYEFECDLFTWINVDIFADIPESDKTEVCVKLPEEYTNQNTLVFMYFVDIQSILALRGDPDEKLFCEPYGATPIGMKVKFIVISNQDEDVFHFALVDAIIEKDHFEEIFPEEKSIDEIVEIIKNL